MSPLTGVMRDAWAMYKAHAAHFLLISLVVYVAAAILVAIATAFGGIVGTFVSWVIDLFAMFLLQAALVKAVQDVRDGTADLDLRATVKAALPYVAPVAGASILASILIAIGFAIIIVPGLILLTFLSMIVPSIVIGESRALDSFGRSWRTVRGYGWNVFGTYVLVFLIWIVFQLVLSAIMLALPAAVGNFVSNVIAGTLFTPFIALVVTLAYYRLTAAHAGAAAGPYGTYAGGSPPGGAGGPYSGGGPSGGQPYGGTGPSPGGEPYAGGGPYSGGSYAGGEPNAAGGAYRDGTYPAANPYTGAEPTSPGGPYTGAEPTSPGGPYSAGAPAAPPGPTTRPEATQPGSAGPQGGPAAPPGDGPPAGEDPSAPGGNPADASGPDRAPDQDTPPEPGSPA